MSVPGPENGFYVTTKDVWMEVMRLRADLAATMSNAADVPDHENRLRALERWRYALPASVLFALASAGTTIAGLVLK